MHIAVKGEKDGVSTKTYGGGEWRATGTLEDDNLHVERVEKGGCGEGIEEKACPAE